MQLIGMLDSPYVRRVAIALQMMDIPFEHKSLSVFRDVDELSLINPLIKAPTFVCDNGDVLMDSNLILQYAASIAAKDSIYAGDGTVPLSKELRLIGLALNACDKSVQYYYETGQRPHETRHQPWVDRIVGQLNQAYQALNDEISSATMLISQHGCSQAAISAAVAYKFTENMVPASIFDVSQFSKLASFSELAEQLPAFKRAPYGDSTYPVE